MHQIHKVKGVENLENINKGTKKKTYNFDLYIYVIN